MFLICPATNFLVDGSSAAVARWRQSSGSGQHGGSVGSVVVVAAERWQRSSSNAAMAAWRWWQCGGSAAALRRAAWRQRGGSGASSTPAAAGLAAAAEVCWHCSISGGSRAAGAVLPPRTVTVATKTPAAIAMVGALPTINNQLKAAAAMAMETMTTTTHKT